ncbi:MAG: GxGYxYP domain-containing protein [Acidobacteriaceae bacterium]
MRRRAFIQTSAFALGGILTASRDWAADEAVLHVLAKSKAPARTVFAVHMRRELSTCEWDMRLTLSCLQGIVNRPQPQLYLIHDHYDELWLDWLRERGDIDRIEWINVTQTLDRFLTQTSCMFVTDSSVPASVNVATMLAGVYNGLVATPETFKQYNLPIDSKADSLQNGLDLRKMGWKKDLEAYQWAFRVLDAHLSRQAICLLHPTEVAFRDYLVEFNIPTLWSSGPQAVPENPAASPKEEKRFARDILMKWPPNIPCLGWPSAGDEKEWGLGEGEGMQMISECAKFEVCTAFDGYSPTVGNLSMHSGTSATLSQSVPPVQLQRDRVYCAFIRSDGDGMNFIRYCYRQLFDDPRHGEVPLGWQLGPMVSDLMPDAADYYYKHARAGDCFVNALTGAGYIWEEYYAKGYPKEQQQRILQDYKKLSAQYMRRIDATVMCTGDDMPPNLLELFASERGIRGIFENYVRTMQTTLDNTSREIADVPVFRNVAESPSEWLTKNMEFTSYAQAETVRHVIVATKEWTPHHRPAFVYVGLNNWLREMGSLAQIAEGLGPDYVIVRPDQLVQLYLQSRRT